VANPIQGLLAPFRRDQKNDFASGSGPDLLTSKVVQVLGTEGETAVSIGELPWRTAFGSPFHILRHQNNSEVLAALARSYARDALQRWVPDAELLGVTVTQEDDALYVVIRFRQAALGARGPEYTASVPVGTGA
jgi:phage gp46-like protein